MNKIRRPAFTPRNLTLDLTLPAYTASSLEKQGVGHSSPLTIKKEITHDTNENNTNEREQRPGEHEDMKAIVYHTYGSPDVLKLEEVQKPVPQDDEVLVKVRAASVNAGDWAHLLGGKPFMLRLMGYGLLKPKHTILGSDVAGRVEAVGRNVKQFQTR